MLIVTSEHLPGCEITAVHGLAQGSTIRAKHLGRDIGAGLKNLVGGELKGYSELMEQSRNEAIERMTEHAASMGANAIIAARFTTSELAGGAAEVYAYGTAVTIA
ncbi:MAG: YbjQ family protein [Actinomycetia bacterium]|nr:YbjQ family protein [Actinomycetes bacterium]MCP4087748.1 YbjQ family protein [Actinomycetes bacterium]